MRSLSREIAVQPTDCPSNALPLSLSSRNQRKPRRGVRLVQFAKADLKFKTRGDGPARVGNVQQNWPQPGLCVSPPPVIHTGVPQRFAPRISAGAACGPPPGCRPLRGPGTGRLTLGQVLVSLSALWVIIGQKSAPWALEGGPLICGLQQLFHLKDCEVFLSPLGWHMSADVAGPENCPTESQYPCLSGRVGH